MKKILVSAIAVLLLISCKAQDEITDNRSLLWRISGHGLAKPSYLFGTIHMLCPDDYLWTDAMKKSLAACRQVCFELDMDNPEVLTEASEGLLGDGSKKLKDYFTPEQWIKVTRFMHDSIGSDLNQMQMMKPMMLESLLASKTINCAFPISYEANIMEQAQKDKIEVVGLEDVKEQIAVVNTLPDDSVVASLMQMTDSFAQTKAEYARMLSAYKQQDLAALYALIKSSKELGDELGAFLDDRNKKWIPRMAKMMPQKTTFFAVGAGHLWGDAGIIVLLRKSGYTVTPVR